MALNKKVVKIENDSRDNGLKFEVTEMPLDDADRWARRVALAMMRSGIRMSNSDLMDLKTTAGILEIAKFGVTAFGYMDEDLALELTDELLEKCVKIIPTGGEPREIVEGDLQSISTKMRLRWEAFAVHNDFLELGNFSNSNL